MEQLLTKLYFDPKSGFQSADKLYRKAKEQDKKITRKDVQTFLSGVNAEQVTKLVRRPKKFSSIYASYPGDIYQMDIMVYKRYAFHHYEYVLNVIDVYSRYAKSVALTNVTGSNIVEKVEKIMNEMGWPTNISSDNQFDFKEFNNLMKKHNVKVWFSEPYGLNHNAIVERFNRTLARMLQKWRIATKRYDWYKVLNDIVDNYNETYHRTIGEKPIDVWEGKKENRQEIKVVEPSFNIGDKVRIKERKKVFAKGDELSYSKEIFTVEKVGTNRIKLDNGKSYKPYELVKVGNVIYEHPPPEEEEEKEQEKEHLETQREKKIVRKGKKEGIEFVSKELITQPRITRSMKGTGLQIIFI